MVARTPPNPDSNYRPDIDGLRAIAVLSVVGFHAFPQAIRGGFIGVDIFFVISGYLISTILFENLQHGRFSLVQFYCRRIRRIFPALLLVLITVLVFGWFALFANEYQQLGKHVAAGAAFIANYIFWSESGYFDTAAITKPLLHLWSLGIEEQFYILWPVILWLGWRVKANLLAVALGLAVVSFGLNLYGIRHDVVATFYAPQTRFWELLSGSLLAWLMVLRPGASDRFMARVDGWLGRIMGRDTAGLSANLLSVLGLLFIVGGIAIFHSGLSFPGMRAVIPVIGAVLIIAAGAESWLNRTLLSHRILVWFGLISYPLYLWHWPILSLVTTIEGENLSPVAVSAALLLAVALAWLTFRWVERPIRSFCLSRYVILGSIALLSVTGIVGYAIYSKLVKVTVSSEKQEFLDHFENSFPKWQYFSQINLIKEWRSECAYIDTEKMQKNGFLEGGIINSKPIKQLDTTCYKRNKSIEKSVLVWGDSHAQALSPGLVRFMPKNWQILQIASSGCRPSIDVLRPSDFSQCDQSNYFAVKTIKEVKPDVVVIAQALGHSSENMVVISQYLRKIGVKRVLYLGSTPNWNSALPLIFARKLWIHKPKRTFTGIKFESILTNERLSRELAEEKSLEFINVINLFCNPSGCLTYTGEDVTQTLTTWDYGHLTISGSIFLAEHLLVPKIVQKLNDLTL